MNKNTVINILYYLSLSLLILARMPSPRRLPGLGRLYPLVLLQELYLSQADVHRAGEMLELIEKTPMNEKNTNMKVLRRRAENNIHHFYQPLRWKETIEYC